MPKIPQASNAIRHPSIGASATYPPNPPAITPQ
jgi:hypothetical protein